MKRKIIGILVALVLAIVGTTALAAYVQQAKEDAVDEVAPVQVLVVQRDVPAGAPLAVVAAAVSLEDVPPALVSPDALTSLDEIDATYVTAVALVPNEQLLRSRLVPSSTVARVEVPAGLQEITLALDPERAVGGALQPGELVGMLLSFDAMNLDDANVTVATDDTGDTVEEEPLSTPKQTHMVLNNILVTAVQFSFSDTQREPQTVTTNEDGDVLPTTTVATAPSSILLVTLAVTTKQAEQIAFAAEFGTVWLTRQNIDTDITGGEIITLDKVYGTVPE